MPGASYRLPAEIELAMPQYTIKLNTYDPVIVEAFSLLRKNRKQAAFTQEALKYFLASEMGVQVIDLMCRDNSSSLQPTHKVNPVEQPKDSVPKARNDFLSPASNLAKDSCCDVMEKILK
jgi:hypothetical protein